VLTFSLLDFHGRSSGLEGEYRFLGYYYPTESRVASAIGAMLVAGGILVGRQRADHTVAP
jgi:hypothetical protein